MIRLPAPVRPRWRVPEVVQTSSMDCGPASLLAMLRGFGLRASYGRLREACQTDVDGTSIDVIEKVAVQLGLDAQQVVVPADHVLLDDPSSLPAIAVVRLPNGNTHFAVAWKRVGPFVQVMDPAKGRRWLTRRSFLHELYQHRMEVPAGAWRDWAGSPEGRRAWIARLRALGDNNAEEKVDRALGDPSWRSIATLDAAARMTHALRECGALRRGRESVKTLSTLLEKSRAEGSHFIPRQYWSVRPPESEVTKVATQSEPPDAETLMLEGAVLVRVHGASAQPASSEDPADDEESEIAASNEGPISKEMVSALTGEESSSPWAALWQMVIAHGRLAPWLLAGTQILAAGLVVLEALLLRGLLDASSLLGTPRSRLAAGVAVIALAGLLSAVQWPLIQASLRLGRRLEIRLRLSFLDKLPRLGDRYFASRLHSDMTERSHAMHDLRRLPRLLRDLLQVSGRLFFTGLALIWLAPASAPLILMAAFVVLTLPILLHPFLAEKDLRARTHAGALARFYLEGLLGLVAVQVHGADTALRREHESLLGEWWRAARGQEALALIAEAMQRLAGFGLAAALVFQHLAVQGTAESLLLLAYWALQIPALGQQIVNLGRQLPAQRNIAMRLLEPLSTPEQNAGDDDFGSGGDGPMKDESEEASEVDAPPTRDAGVAIEMHEVRVTSGGHHLLEDLSLRIGSGEHVAVVGASGAGKSTLVSLLLGFHQPADGQLEVDGEPLRGAVLDRLRERTAWVDPAVQIWNGPLIDNLLYGAPETLPSSLHPHLRATGVLDVVRRLPEGLRTSLGESGGLVSGGEGQRVRLARAWLREDAKLVILDEAFRGLDRPSRRRLLTRARRHWPRATLLCISHDLAETLSFPRVLVLHEGRVLEDGDPTELRGRAGSRYASLLGAEIAARKAWLGASGWRRLKMQRGSLVEGHAAGSLSHGEGDS